MTYFPSQRKKRLQAPSKAEPFSPDKADALQFDEVVTTNALADLSRLLRDRMDHDIVQPLDGEDPQGAWIRSATASHILNYFATHTENAWEDYRPNSRNAYAGLSPQEARKHALSGLRMALFAELDEVSQGVGGQVEKKILQENRPDPAFRRTDQVTRAVDAGIRQAHDLVTGVFDDLLADQPYSGRPGAAAACSLSVSEALEMAQEMMRLNPVAEPKRNTLQGVFAHTCLTLTMNTLQKAFNLLGKGVAPTEPEAAPIPLRMAGAVLTELGLVQPFPLYQCHAPEYDFQSAERLDQAETIRAVQFREVRRSMEVIRESIYNGQLHQQATARYERLATTRFNHLTRPPLRDIAGPATEPVVDMLNAIITGIHMQTRSADGYPVDADNPMAPTPSRMLGVPLSLIRH